MESPNSTENRFSANRGQWKPDSLLRVLHVRVTRDVMLPRPLFWIAASGIMLGVLLSCAAQASPSRLRPSRPLHADPAEGVETGSAIVETGARFTEVGQNQTQQAFPLLLRFQLLPILELRAGADVYAENAGRSGFGQTQLGTKLSFLDQGFTHPALGLLGRVLLPTGSEGVAADGTTVEALFLLSKDLFGWVELDLNAGIQSTTGDGSDDSMGLPIYVAGSLPIFGLFDFFGELAILTNLDGVLDDPSVTSLVGARFVAIDSMCIDGALEMGLSDDAPEFGVHVGLTWHFTTLY